jgi:protein LTV1
MNGISNVDQLYDEFVEQYGFDPKKMEAQIGEARPSKEKILNLVKLQETKKEEYEEIEVEEKKEDEEEWDCESIVSTYSNQYNHPAIIGAPESGPKIKLSKGIPVGVLPPKKK